MTDRIVHFEIPFDDGERARSFYKEAFDWTIQEMPEMDYTLVMTGPVSEQGAPSEPGYINGGMFQRSADFSRSPVITVGVDSIDATLARVEKLGGKTVKDRSPVGEMGFYAYFTDPEGNVMGLWENAAPS